MQEEPGASTSPTLSEWAPSYLDVCRTRLRPRTVVQTESLMRRIVDLLGDVTLQELGQRHISQLVGSMQLAGLRPATINRTQAVLLDVAKQAHRAGVRTKPADFEAHIQADARGRQHALTHDQYRALIGSALTQTGVALGQWRVLVTLGVFTGMRAGELQGLQWRDIDWDGRTVTVRRTISEVAGKQLVAPTKGLAARTLPLPDEAYQALFDRFCLFAGTRESSVGRTHLVPPQHPWVFCRIEGRQEFPAEPASRSQLRHGWDALMMLSKLQDAFPSGARGMHLMRHTYATWLARAGTELPVLRELMGHASIEQTARYIAPSRDAARRAVDSAFSTVIH